MTKFDKLNGLVTAWTADPSYWGELCEYLHKICPSNVVAHLWTSLPGRIRFAVSRRDYLGRVVRSWGWATSDGVELEPDPVTNRVHKTLLKQLDFFYDQV